MEFWFSLGKGVVWFTLISVWQQIVKKNRRTALWDHCSSFPVDLDDDLSLLPKRGSLESCARSQLAIFFCPADSYVSVSAASHCVSTYAVSVSSGHLWTDFDAFESLMTEWREFGTQTHGSVSVMTWMTEWTGSPKRVSGITVPSVSVCLCAMKVCVRVFFIRSCFFFFLAVSQYMQWN